MSTFPPLKTPLSFLATGCVLCSPGCFSLFRGKALMDDNVMAKYTLRSEEPRHYVQYDQGTTLKTVVFS